MTKALARTFFVCLLTAAPAWAQAPLWTPIADEVFLQEVGRQVPTDQPLTHVATFEGRLYAVLGDTLCVLEGDRLQPLQPFEGGVKRLDTLQGKLWLISGRGLHRYDGETWTTLAEGEFTDLCEHVGSVAVAGKGGLWTVQGDALAPIPGAEGPTPAHLASYGENLHLVVGNRFAVFNGAAYEAERLLDWGALPQGEVRDVHRLGSRLFFATSDGLGQLRGMAMTQVHGEDGLPYEDATCLASGFDRDLWIGTTRGAVRRVGDAWHYFQGQRWLPNDKVNAIACGERVAYLATDGGLGIVAYEPYTLKKKADHYERWLEEWGMKRLGFTHKLEWDDALGEWVREVSDNDVGFSSHYLAALCFKYAVTKDPEVRREAVHMFESVAWSEEITSIDGFPARSVWAVGEEGHQAQHGSGGLPAEWHETPDGLWQWKGDTSSDETDAHYYVTGIFLDLVAQGREVDLAKRHLTRLTDHIVSNGWYLKDVDGLPTRWARWDPEYLQRPYGFYARGLNGMEAMSYATLAYKRTGEARFKEAQQQLIEWGYPDEALRQKLVFPPEDVTQFDDRLAFYTYFSLLRNLDDPALRPIYMRSLERTWEIERIEANPWYSFIYGILTGNDFESEPVARHLREWPLDCVDYAFQNSHRHDLHTPEGYVSYAGCIKPMSPRSHGVIRWSEYTGQLDGGSGGRAVMDPSGFIEVYWMGRYFGFIEPPTVTEPDLLTAPPRGLQLGAKPYAGPERPTIEY